MAPRARRGIRRGRFQNVINRCQNAWPHICKKVIRAGRTWTHLPVPGTFRGAAQTCFVSCSSSLCGSRQSLSASMDFRKVTLTVSHMATIFKETRAVLDLIPCTRSCIFRYRAWCTTAFVSQLARVPMTSPFVLRRFLKAAHFAIRDRFHLVM